MVYGITKVLWFYVISILQNLPWLMMVMFGRRRDWAVWKGEVFIYNTGSSGKR